MSRLAEDLARETIRLPEAERIRVVEKVLASLHKGRARDIDAAWAAEAERRFQEFKRGAVRPISWKTVKSRAKKRVRAPS